LARLVKGDEGVALTAWDTLITHGLHIIVGGVLGRCAVLAAAITVDKSKLTLKVLGWQAL